MKDNIGAFSITVNNRKYSYSIGKSKYKGAVYFECKAARISQVFAVEDLPELFEHLPEYILEEIERRAEPKTIIQFRISSDDKKEIMKKAQKNGFKSVSSYLRFLALGR